MNISHGLSLMNTSWEGKVQK